MYKRLVGNLVYLIATRHDVKYAISFISIFMESPEDSHWKVGKKNLRYIVGTYDYGMWYTTSKDNTFTGYIDNDFYSSIDDRKSTPGYIFYLGKKLISWASKK